MDREQFDKYVEKYRGEETAKSGVLTEERRRIFIEFLENPKSNQPKVRHQIKKKNYELIRGKLCQRKEINGVITYLEIPSVEEFYDVISRIHEETGHEGITKTFKAVQLRYAYVPREIIDVYIQGCLTCQLKRTQKKQVPLKPILSTGPLQRCQIDLINMSEHQDGKFKYILTFIDHFSKFVVLKPLASKKNCEVVNALEEGVFAYFGVPAILQSDNGGEFSDVGIGNLIKDWPGECKLVHGRPRHPQSQGVVERANRTVKEKLAVKRTLHTEEKYRWSAWLPEISYQTNTTFHATIRMTPYEVMFGRRPFRHVGENLSEDEADTELAPLQLSSSDMSDTPEDSRSDTHSPPRPENGPSEIIRMATRNTTKAAERIIQKSKPDRSEIFKIGDFVTVAVPKIDQKNGAEKRLPAVVVDTQKAGLYRLRCRTGILKRQYRADALHHFKGHLNLTTNGWRDDPQITLREAARKDSDPTTVEQNVWPVLTRPCLEKLVKENFDELSCEIALDTVSKIHQDAALTTASHIWDILPGLPQEQPQQFQSYQLGRFGDGYVKHLPPSELKKYMVALETNAEGNSCFYKAVSLLLYGNEDKSMFIRLGSTTIGLLNSQLIVKHILDSHPSADELMAFLSSATTDAILGSSEGSPEEMVTYIVNEEVTRSFHPQRDAGPIQIMCVSLLTGREVKVWTMLGGNESATVYGPHTGNALQVVLLPLDPKSDQVSHFSPLIEGKLIGMGSEKREECGALQFDLCQGEDSHMVECDHCFQWYHIQCVIRKTDTSVLAAGFKCGCHVIQPLQPKSVSFYKDLRRARKAVREISIEKLCYDIKEGVYTSGRWTASRSNSSIARRTWKTKIGFHRFSEPVIAFFGKELSKMPYDDSHILDVFLPEMAVHVTMQQEEITRLSAELLLQVCQW